MPSPASTSALAPAPDSPLFRAFPRLAGRIPYLPLGTRETPVHRLDRLGSRFGAGELWVKRDDQTADPYGGNKVRKLEFLLADARERGRSRIVTFGAVGSHHVFATALYGGGAGFRVEAVMTPQPVTPHVAEMARLNGSWLARVWMARNYAEVPFRWAEALATEPGYRATYRIPAGGSSPVGCLGYVAAALELREQVARGLLPEPEVVVVPLGSCGTAAGLLAGLSLAGFKARLVAVRVVDRAASNGGLVRALAYRTLRRLRREDRSVVLPARSSRLLDVRHEFFGPGYGHPTPEGEAAMRLFRDEEGIDLDPTYTGKAGAALLRLLEGPDRHRPVLFWDTLSSSPLGPLLEEARPVDEILEPLRRYARACGGPTAGTARAPSGSKSCPDPGLERSAG